MLSKQKIRGCPATSGKINRAGRKTVRLPSSRQIEKHHTREALLNKFPEAHDLSVYDGQIHLGFIVDLGVKKLSYAYRVDGSSIGVFKTRRGAMAAVGARHE